MKKTFRLNLGCGHKMKKDHINCDMIDYYGHFLTNTHNVSFVCYKHPDILLNLDLQLPFKDNSVDSINADKLLGHLKNPEYTLSEMKRVLKVDGSIHATGCNCHDSNPQYNNDYIFFKGV